ncbi:MAG: carboxypeptidase regulatory-like domain-containing protein [Pirellulaceae bacterium]|nr:carboxypeptidase regulatory-like domain-containing protein [Pirellulaceae bacterium]
MPKQSQKPVTIRESWRADSANAEQLASRQRSALRWVITTLLVLSVAAWGYLLFGPFFHPTLRLYYLTAGSYDALDLKPIPYFKEDAVRFLSIDGSFRKDDAVNEFSIMDSPEVVRKYLQRIVNSPSQKSDVTLLEISAHPLMDGERPFLKCSNFNPATAENSTVSVEELLNLLDRMSVGVTLICLNLGPTDSQSTEDSAREDFLYSLRDLMKSRTNANQWILVSNSPHEGSYASLELQASVFSAAITKALQGSADLNKDATIDLDEFTRFVVGFTQAQVERESGGNTQQTPLLFSTASSSSAPLNLIAIASTPSQGSSFSFSGLLSSLWGAEKNSEEADGEIKAKEAEEAQKEKGWLTEYLQRSSERIQELTMEEIEDNINVLPSFLGNKVKKSIGLEEAPAESTYAQAQTEESVAADSVPTNENETNTSTTDQAALPPEPIERSRKPIPDVSRLADAQVSNVQLLQIAWQFCEYFELPQEGVMRPVDMAPHAWNEFISHFHGIEERVRMDSAVDARTIRLQLTSEIVGAYQLANTGQAQVGTIAKRVSAQLPALDFKDAAFPSVGMLECLAEYGGPSFPNSISDQVQRFDAALSRETSESFEKWHSQLPSELSTQYLEFFWARQFASRSGTPWRITRRVLELWRQYERHSCDPLTSNAHVQQSLILSQRLLLEGTRLALDQIGADWVDRCLGILDKAEQTLIGSLEKLDQLRNALRLRNQTLAELRSILRWRKIAATQLGSTQLDEDIERTLNSLRKMCDLLQDREQCELSEVLRNHDSLKASLNRIQAIWIEESTKLLQGDSSPSISANWISDSLLATPFIRGPLRNRLLALPLSATQPANAEIDLDQKLPVLFSNRMSTQNTERQVRFESIAAGLAGLNADFSSMEPFQIAGEVDRFYDGLGESIQKSFSSLESSTPEKDLLPQLRTLRLADQALRLIPALDSHLMDGKPLESRLWELEVLQSTLRKQDSIQKFVQDALPQEVRFINDTSARLAFLASTLSRTPPYSTQATSRLNLRGTTNISLMTETVASGEIVLQNVGKTINNAWVLVDYDPNVLELQGPTGIALHQVSTLPQKFDAVRRQAEQQLMQAIASEPASKDRQQSVDDAQKRVAVLANYLNYPIHPEPSTVSPTMGLAAGQRITIPFKVRRLGPGPSQSKLIWKLVGDDEYVRHEMMVQLPEAERLRLVADGVANSWAPSDEGLDLFLWPNRGTEFRVGLQNNSGKARVLSVELVALMSRREVTLPEGFLTSSASKEIENILGPTKLIAAIPEITLDTTSDPMWLELQPLGIANAAAPEAAAKEKAPDSIPTNQGLILVFTEKATNQRYWRRISTRVRHPRSYIEPTVRFDALSERAEILLNVRQQDFVPDQGIEVVGRIVEQLPRGTEMKLEGVIRARETLTLHCQVPTVSTRELTVELDIDGFPRAFVIKIPCWRTNADIPIVSDFQRIEFVDPKDGLNVGPDQKSQAIKLRIDAIPGAFESKRDYVEVGWDLDRDREFANETTVKFAAERQIDVAVNSILNGRISLTAKVDDIAFELPPPPLKNQPVNLLARLFAGGETVWSKPVEIIADSDPPTITGVEVSPSTTFPQGSDLNIRVGVDDAKLSGIASVEFKVDSKGVGKFADSAAAPKLCVRESDSSWVFTLPTADLVPGRATLLVRATDLAGNKSEDAKSVLTIVSEQEWKAKLKSVTYEIAGTVLYVDAPLPNAKVTLEDEKGAIAQTTKTDEQGAFRILGLQPGKYKIIAIGVMKNRPRKAEKLVELGKQAQPLRLQMSAK